MLFRSPLKIENCFFLEKQKKCYRGSSDVFNGFGIRVFSDTFKHAVIVHI